jgi:hypothetical protein
MEFTPYKNSRETLADIMSSSKDLALEKDPELKMIDNTETIEYTSYGMCGYPTVIVI